MSTVTRLRCDGCNAEQAVTKGVGPWAPDGWYVIEGVYGGGEPYDRYHACSLECLISWADRQRQAESKGPVAVVEDEFPMSRKRWM